MTGPPAIRSSAEGPAPEQTGEVFVRSSDGSEARRIPRAMADRLVVTKLADVVSAAGHVRLKPGIPLVHDFGIHGLCAVEQLRQELGDKRAARWIKHRDRSDGKWQPPRQAKS
jgi:hypothetical protein